MPFVLTLGCKGLLRCGDCTKYRSCAGADLQGGLGGLQPPLQLLQPWISEVGDEEEEVEERRKWREGEEEEEISPPLIHFLDPPLGLGISHNS